jgi:serine/threonine protein kinase
MEKGSLFCALRNDVGAVELKWMKRAHIIKDIAHALSYLHHDCNPPIVHRDISSSNVLLNSVSKSFVADFGVARLLDPDSSNHTVLAGTYGYIAPGQIFLLYIRVSLMSCTPTLKQTLSYIYFFNFILFMDRAGLYYGGDREM